MAAYVASLFDATLTWKDIEWLAQLTKMPVVVKSICDGLRPGESAGYRSFLACAAFPQVVTHHTAEAPLAAIDKHRVEYWQEQRDLRDGPLGRKHAPIGVASN
jgi:FMN-dependent dehydrogenase